LPRSSGCAPLISAALPLPLLTRRPVRTLPPTSPRSRVRAGLRVSRRNPEIAASPATTMPITTAPSRRRLRREGALQGGHTVGVEARLPIPARLRADPIVDEHGDGDLGDPPLA